MDTHEGFLRFLVEDRSVLRAAPPAVRMVYKTTVNREAGDQRLELFVADKAPLFYRKLQEIQASLQDGYFVSSVHDTLARIPTDPNFRVSHFGEIVSAIFGQ